MKLKRSALIHALDATFGGAGTPNWYVIGKDVEDMSVNTNPQTETKKNILDENTVEDNGYEPSVDVNTYFADPSDGAFYEKIKDITMNRQTGDECKTTILEVLIDKEDAPYDGWTEDVIIKPTSYGGAQGGVRIPYSISFSGNRKQVKVNFTGGKPSIVTE